MRLHGLIEGAASAALALQDRKDGSMPPGHNGPHADPETPVRNTAHWLVSFCHAYERSGDARFLDAAVSAARYLTSTAARPEGGAFWARENPRKDRSNGLIGQAWPIEALAVAAPALRAPELARVAEEVFLLHPFDERAGLWQRITLAGEAVTWDFTFNHQLWFAAAGCLLEQRSRPEVGRRVRRFLDRLGGNLSVTRAGRIRHGLTPRRLWTRETRYALRHFRDRWVAREELASKALGYQAFNLYALALLCTRHREHRFFASRRFRRVLAHAQTPEFHEALADNPYGYPYNPAGFEMAYALQAFGDDAQGCEPERWVAEQLRRHFDPERRSLSLATPDPATLNARLYEASRLPDLPVPVPASWDR